jgi:hypothetical protein
MPKTQKTGKKESKKKFKDENFSGEATEIVCVIDRSGSMASIRNDAIGGFNNFLAEQQKEPGEATMTIVLFDHEYLINCSGKPVKDVVPFTPSTYVPRGSTALLDAVGRSINEITGRNPKKAIIVILTDGQENSSKEFTKQQIKTMIEDCQKKGWVVMYLSANADAFEDGKSIGLSPSQIMPFQSNTRGAHVGTMSMSMMSTDYRRHGFVGQSATYSARAQSEYDSKHKKISW